MAHRQQDDTPAGDAHPSKSCAICGRTITWRKKWQRDWDQVKVCSEACRRRGLTPTDQAVEEGIRVKLASRARSSSICPSEVAREVGGDDWSQLMEPVRMAARRLVAAGEVEITQGGRVVDPSTARGPIRIRRRS